MVICRISLKTVEASESGRAIELKTLTAAAEKQPIPVKSTKTRWLHIKDIKDMHDLFWEVRRNRS